MQSSILQQQKLLLSLEKFETFQSKSLSDLVNFSKSKNEPIHRWFRYREGFSSLLVKHFLKQNDGWVLDPFCGSGTTLVTSLLNKHNSIGIDLNPLATFMAKIKTQKLSNEEIKTIQSNIPKIFNNTSYKLKIPQLKIINKAFHPKILERLLIFRNNILDLENPTRDFLFFAWLSILETVSNTKKEGNGIKYRSTIRTKNGYIHIDDNIWQQKYFGHDKLNFLDNALHNKLEQMISDTVHARYHDNPTTARVITGDNSNFRRYLYNEKISTILFSPPYANSFDYFEIFKLELWLGEFVKNYSELRNLRKQAIGSLWSKNNNLACPKELQPTISLLEQTVLWNNKIKNMLISYFSKMNNMLIDFHKTLTNNGKCVIVIGNSAYGNILIPTDMILSQMSKSAGFKKVKIHVARHLTTSSQQKKKLEPLKQYLRESVLVLEK